MYTESLRDEFLFTGNERSQKYVVFRDSIFSDLFFPHKIEDIFHRKEDLSFYHKKMLMLELVVQTHQQGGSPLDPVVR